MARFRTTIFAALLAIIGIMLAGCHAAAIGRTSVRLINASDVSTIAGYATGPGTPTAFGRDVTEGTGSCFTQVDPGALDFQIGSGIPGEDPNVTVYATGTQTVQGAGGTIISYGASAAQVGFLPHAILTGSEAGIQAFYTGTVSGSFDVYAVPQGGSPGTTNQIGTISASNRAASGISAFPASEFSIIVTPVGNPTTTVASLPSLFTSSGKRYVMLIEDDPSSSGQLQVTPVRECDDAGPTTGAFVNAIPDGGSFGFSLASITLSNGIAYGGVSSVADISTIANGQAQTSTLTRISDGSTTTGSLTLQGLNDYTFFAIGNVFRSNLTVVAKSVPFGFVPATGRWAAAVVDGVGVGTIDLYLVPVGSSVGAGTLVGPATFGDVVVPAGALTGSYRFVATASGQPNTVLAQSAQFVASSGTFHTGVVVETSAGNYAILLVNR